MTEFGPATSPAKCLHSDPPARRALRRALPPLAAAVFVLLLVAPPSAEAKKFRYNAGPKAKEDTVFTVAEEELVPVVRKGGPKVPATNLEVVRLTANSAIAKAVEGIPLENGATVVLGPAESHPLNFVFEHALLREFSDRGIHTIVRRTPLPDDSLSVIAALGGPMLDYQLASARVTYLRYRGFIPGRVKIERQALVEGSLTLRDPASGKVIWLSDARHNLVDQFPRTQVALVEDVRYEDLKSPTPSRSAGKLIEPIIVIGIVAGLVALFFQNRP